MIKWIIMLIIFFPSNPTYYILPWSYWTSDVNSRTAFSHCVRMSLCMINSVEKSLSISNPFKFNTLTSVTVGEHIHQHVWKLYTKHWNGAPSSLWNFKVVSATDNSTFGPTASTTFNGNTLCVSMRVAIAIWSRKNYGRQPFMLKWIDGPFSTIRVYTLFNHVRFSKLSFQF